ncbi:MAG: formylglycine-generating enzyme family protein [Candidatus Krumholzibacteria bacterium]|nr:formylglycine-generating enzyme family protein [Candidatus Krumholzibacteria bacterium]
MKFWRMDLKHFALAAAISSAVLAGCGDDDTVRPKASKYTPPEDFVSIAVDTFVMGSPYSTHTVILTTPFYMRDKETTNLEYTEMLQWAYDRGYCTVESYVVKDSLDGSTETLLYMSSGSCAISFSADTFAVAAGMENRPVRCMSWYGAAAYCDWLNMKEGLSRAYDHSTWQCNGNDPYGAEGFRLPTEAEWEYACRAGTTTLFNTGDCLDSATDANYNGTQPYSGCSAGPYVGDIVDVGSYLPNGFGLYDMHGNLWEWCNDWYTFDGYAVDATDPIGPLVGDSRIVRGGSWSYSASLCTSSARSWNPPSDTIWLLGFRPVISGE